MAVSVRELAIALSVKAAKLITMLRQMGETKVSPKHMVEPDTAELVASEFGLRAKRLTLKERYFFRSTKTHTLTHVCPCEASYTEEEATRLLYQHVYA